MENLLQTVDQKTDTEIVEQGKDFLAKAEGITIVDDFTNAVAMEELEEISQAKKTVEMHRKRFTEPLLKLKSAFDQHFKVLAEPILKADKILRDKVLAYGKGKIRRSWDFEIINEAEVPDLYWSIDEKKIKAIIQAGATDIPGIRIFQKESLIVGGIDWDGGR